MTANASAGFDVDAFTEQITSVGRVAGTRANEVLATLDEDERIVILRYLRDLKIPAKRLHTVCADFGVGLSEKTIVSWRRNRETLDTWGDE